MPDVFVKPAASNAVIPDPVDFRPLPATGAWKPRSPFWERRLRDGDVVEASPPIETPVARPSPGKPESKSTKSAESAQ